MTAAVERTGPTAPPALRALRYGLWALLAMVLLGLVAVWFWGPGGRARTVAARLPDLGRVPAFRLVERSGAAVSGQQLRGRPWVAALVFTRCRVSCPLLVERLAAVELAREVRRVAISVDPGHDTPAVLAAYAREHGIDRQGWLLLTGAEEQVRRLAVGGFKLGVARTPADHPAAAEEPITHSTRVVLVDAGGVIRGYYDVFDETSEAALRRDAAALALVGVPRSPGGAVR